MRCVWRARTVPDAAGRASSGALLPAMAGSERHGVRVGWGRGGWFGPGCPGGTEFGGRRRVGRQPVPQDYGRHCPTSPHTRRPGRAGGDASVGPWARRAARPCPRNPSPPPYRGRPAAGAASGAALRQWRPRKRKRRCNKSRPPSFSPKTRTSRASTTCGGREWDGRVGWAGRGALARHRRPTHPPYPRNPPSQPGKCLYTSMRELVENSLDAAESVNALPEIDVTMCDGGRSRVGTARHSAAQDALGPRPSPLAPSQTLHSLIPERKSARSA